jgi:Holliday junction resolvase RusA-like endonuclease
MTRPAKAWKKYVEEAVRWEIKSKKWSLSGDETHIVVNINTFLNRPMDADNVLKLTLDACAKAMGINDVRFLPRVWKMERRHKVEYMTLEFVEENGND